MAVALHYSLRSGQTPKQIAKRFGISRQMVWKYARKYEREGLIERVHINPAWWQARNQAQPHPRMGGEAQPSATAQAQPNTGSEVLAFHNFGADFMNVGKARPPLPKDKNNLAWVKMPLSHTARFGPNTTTIWMKHYRGTSVQEQIANAQQDTLALARFYEAKYGLALAFKRWHPGIEWCIAQDKASDKAKELLGMRQGDKKEIGNVLWKAGDSTHLNMELNALPGAPADAPTEQARALEYLLVHAPYLLRQIVDSIVVVNQKLEVMDKKLEQNKGK